MSNLKDKIVFVTGAGGFLGKHVCRLLVERRAKVVRNKHNLIESSPEIRQGTVDLVIHLAADVRGIGPNRAMPYRFLHTNSTMALNLIGFAIINQLPVVAAGSVCAYPEDAPIPFNEPDFWRGKPDSNNLGYGMAKRFLGGALECAAIEHGLRYAHLISGNLYGPGDHFGEDGHVIPMLIKRFYKAKQEGSPSVGVWGSGKATRDFLYVEDAARAYVRAAEYLLEGHANLECNIGSGAEVSIEAVVREIAWRIGYEGAIDFDTSKPDGQLRRRIDTNKADVLLEWCNTTSLPVGIDKTIRWYVEEMAK